MLAQSPDHPVLSQVRLDLDELDAVYSAAKQLLTQHNNGNLPTYTGELKQAECTETV
jgi:hypothetical protein